MFDQIEITTAIRIEQLRATLAASDYKVIKCAESFLQGKSMPYDVAEVSAARQAIRDQINQLEE